MYSCNLRCIFQRDDVEFVHTAVVFGVYFNEIMKSLSVQL